MVAILLSSNAARARCINDRSRSLQDMITGAQSWFSSELPRTQKDQQKLLARGHPWANVVPKDFKIDSRRVPFAVSTLVGPTRVYDLPSLELGDRNVRALVGSSWNTYRDVAECRAQGPDGQWWLVLRHVGGDLSYIPEDQTELIKPR